MGIESILLIILCFLFLGFLLLGVPVGFSLGGASVITTAVAVFSDQAFDTFSGLDFNVFSLVVNSDLRSHGKLGARGLAHVYINGQFPRQVGFGREIDAFSRLYKSPVSRWPSLKCDLDWRSSSRFDRHYRSECSLTGNGVVAGNDASALPESAGGGNGLWCRHFGYSDSAQHHAHHYGRIDSSFRWGICF